MNRYHIYFAFLSVIFIFTPKIESQQFNRLNRLSNDLQPDFNEYLTGVMDSLIRNLILQTNLDSLINYVSFLSGEDSVKISNSTYLLLSRNALHPHNDQAAEFIFQTLKRFGLLTYNQNYSTTGRNVFALQAGAEFPDHKFIICAHYDDMPMDPPAPGADDNASGTAAVLETARILSKHTIPFTVIYSLWDEEEIGLFGSTYYAQHAYQSGENILGVINLDMIGWDGNNDGLIEIHSQPIAQSEILANLIKSLERQYNLGLNPVIINPSQLRSDHVSFWEQGISAVMLIEAIQSGDLTPYIHTSKDRISSFNLDFFYACSKLAVATTAYLAYYTKPAHREYPESLNFSGFILNQNYPNPFNPITTIAFLLDKSGFVTLSIYNIAGENVTKLISENLSAGRHEFEWNATGMASGVYFYKLESSAYFEVRKCLLLK